MSDQNSNKGPQGSPGGKKPPKKSLNFYWIYAVIAAVLIGMMMLNQGSEGREITYADFEVLAADSLIEKTIIYDGRMVEVYLNKKGREEKQGELNQGLMRSGAGPHYHFNVSTPDRAVEVDEVSQAYKFDNFNRHRNEFGEPGVKADLWAFGCLLIEMVSGAPPWNGRR